MRTRVVGGRWPRSGALMLIAAALVCAVLAAASRDAGTKAAGVGAASPEALTAEFVKLLRNPYDLSGAALPNAFSLKRAGLSSEALAAAEELRTSLRQGLSEVVALAADKSATWAAAAQAELQAAGNSSSTLLQRLSSVPIKFDADGNALLPNPLVAMGAFMVSALQKQLSAAREAGGQALASELAQSSNGRRLLQHMDAFQAERASAPAAAAAAAAAAGSARAGPVAVARQLDRMMDFLGALTDVAGEAMADAGAPHAGSQHGYNDDDGRGAGDGDERAGAAVRRLQQAGGAAGPAGAVYRKEALGLFGNIFDFFGANGWHGLTPILADIRGVLSRYNWIADLVTILDVPLENLANANLFPLPQSDVEFELLVRKFASFYCKYELAASSDTVLAEFDGPRLSLEVKPASCPIYTDEDSGRNYVSFQDCSAATLVIKTTPLTISEPYFSAANYTSTECKYIEPLGVDLTLGVGGGLQRFAFVRSTQGIDIVPVRPEGGTVKRGKLAG